MRDPVTNTLVVALLAGLALFAAACAGPTEPVSLVITNVTVIDPAERRVLADQSVFVADGRIRAIMASGAVSGYVAAATIDGTGQFLIPGLIDSHAHIGGPVDQFGADGATKDSVNATFALLIANGVTGVRALGADCWVPKDEETICLDRLRALADETAAGNRTGPRLLSLSSPLVNGVVERDSLPPGSLAMFAPGTAEEARELVRHLQQRGVDLIKVYNSVPREAYFAMLTEASSLRLEVSGHIPVAVSVVEASNAGQRTIEHARDLPVACSTYEPEFRATMNDVIEGVEGATTPSPAEFMTKTLQGFDAALCQGVLHTLVSNDTYLVPTHGTREMDARAGEAAYRHDPRMKYIHARLRQHWQEDLDRTASARPEVVALYRDFYDSGLRLTALAHAAGIKVMVGSDANDTMIFPGSGVHDEMMRFAQSGIAPMDILRAATAVPAEYFGLSNELGGISEGRLADLVLLGADPLADIRNTTSINAVFMAGRVYDRAALDELLRQAEAPE